MQYNDLNRGKIQNREFASQIRDFTNLRWGNTTPTDIDGFVEFGDKLFFVIEVKYNDTKLPYGQRLAIERLVDAIERSQRVCYGIVAIHKTDGDIDVGGCEVVEYRFQGEWHKPRKYVTVKVMIDYLHEKHIAPL